MGGGGGGGRERKEEKKGGACAVRMGSDVEIIFVGLRLFGHSFI